MQLSVIILNYNVRYFLEQCIISVQKALQNIDGEIIVVDNNSKDDSCQMVRQLFPTVKLIENKENLGFPKGNNIGVAQAQGEYICILNPDTIVAEDTFTKILNNVYQTHPSGAGTLGIIGCKLIDGTGNFLPESKRGVPTPWVAFTKIFGLYKIFPKFSFFNKYYAQHINENQSGEVEILVGAFMVINRKLYIEIGGFDENCFMYSDDIDLSYMVLQKGLKNYYFANTTVIHYKGESTVRDGLYMKRFQEAMNYFYGKHFKKSVVFDTMMQLGTYTFSILKKKQQKNTTFLPEEKIVFTKNLNFKKTKNTLYYSSLEEFKNSNKKTEIIFDIDSFSFTEIIQFMQKNKSKNIVFKNYIPQNNYLIGSNNANDLGEIFFL